MAKNMAITVAMNASIFLNDHDVILTDYETLRKDHLIYSRVHWHRIVLDECQEIKVATNRIASQVLIGNQL